jgi:putative heme-binding domain-containing protein
LVDVAAEWLLEASADERIVLARWAADHRHAALLSPLQAALAQPDQSPRSTLALLAAIADLLGEKFDGDAAQQRMATLIDDPAQPQALRVAVLGAAKASRLDAARLQRLAVPPEGITAENRELAAMAVRTLAWRTVEDREAVSDAVHTTLSAVAQDSRRSFSERADAIAGLGNFREVTSELIGLLPAPPNRATDGSGTAERLDAEILRALVDEPLTASAREQIARLTDASLLPLVERLLAEPGKSRPIESAAALLAELRQLPGQGDPEVGRRLFLNTSLLQCARCHAIENRGASLGPELSNYGRTRDDQQILNAILEPGREIAPQYQTWVIVSQDGRTQVGFHVHSQNLIEIFADAEGREFRVAQDDILQRRASDKSIMPDGTIQRLTPLEIRDLLAYLRESEFIKTRGALTPSSSTLQHPHD